MSLLENKPLLRPPTMGGEANLKKIIYILFSKLKKKEEDKKEYASGEELFKQI